MERVADVAVIATAILNAPGWARVGITMPKSDLRELAAEALARAVLDGVKSSSGLASEAQLALPI